jgi:hypothetical protein
MNEEYLWDKSGEPDPEIQQLEQILGTLRYQPKPLDLPDDIQPVRRNHHFSLIAIAATLLVALLAGGLWLLLNKPEQPSTAIIVSPGSPSPEPTQNVTTVGDKTDDKLSPEPTSPERNKLARNVRHSTRPSPPRFTKQEREEALEVKQQLMLALRVASEKLNLAHRKAQGASPTQIRNQHKVG